MMLITDVYMISQYSGVKGQLTLQVYMMFRVKFHDDRSDGICFDNFKFFHNQ